MQLTILCDNTVPACPGLIGEHGFACHIATNGRQYLFDTGNGLGILNNAERCNIDLTDLDAILLSHGHWDHCGGLIPLLKIRQGRSIPVYAHPAIFDEKVSYANSTERTIGAGFNRAEAEAAGAKFYLSADPVELPGGVIFSGEIPRTFDPQAENTLCYRQAGSLIPDPLLDDQSLYLQSDSGLVILCGCAHAGVRNILTHALYLTDTNKLHALIGGLHLAFKNDEQLSLILNDLKQHELQLIATSHCTGHEAINQLKSALGSIITPGAVSVNFQF